VTHLPHFALSIGIFLDFLIAALCRPLQEMVKIDRQASGFPPRESDPVLFDAKARIPAFLLEASSNLPLFPLYFSPRHVIAVLLLCLCSCCKLFIFPL